MEFICTRENLFKAISSVESIVKSKLSFSPHLSNILLEVTDKIVIKATNGEMAQETSLEGTVQKGGRISIPYSRLSKIIRRIPDVDLTLTLGEDNILKIIPLNSNRKFNIEIFGIPGDDFLNIPAFPVDSKSIVLDKLYFKKMIQKVIFAASSEATRYAIHGVLMELKNQEITLVATDTRKMALFKTVLPDPNQLEESLLLPQELLSHLQKLFLTEGPVSIMIAEHQIFFKFEEHQISSSLVNGEFPKYEMFIPQNNAHSFSATTTELLNALGLGQAVYDESPIPRVVFELKPGELHLFSQEKDYNRVDEVIPIQYQDEEYRVGFNVQMISDILKQIETEKVEIYFNGEISPFVIKENNRKDSTYIIMPVKISQT